MSEEYLRELRQLDLQEKNLQDRHNTLEKPADKHNYQRIVNAKIKIAPITGEYLKDYIMRLKIYQEIAREKNYNTHVDNPYKIWRTHKIPLGCFMCEDIIFISVCIQVLEILAKEYPKYQF